jgi:hypothetical protein
MPCDVSDVLDVNRPTYHDCRERCAELVTAVGQEARFSCEGSPQLLRLGIEPVDEAMQASNHYTISRETADDLLSLVQVVVRYCRRGE